MSYSFSFISSCSWVVRLGSLRLLFLTYTQNLRRLGSFVGSIFNYSGDLPGSIISFDCFVMTEIASLFSISWPIIRLCSHPRQSLCCLFSLCLVILSLHDIGQVRGSISTNWLYFEGLLLFHERNRGHFMWVSLVLYKLVF